MLESNLYKGKQPFTQKAYLKYGVSITDSCIDIEETNKLLSKAALSL